MKTISERIWAKLWDHHGDLDDDFECIAHDAEDIEKKVAWHEVDAKTQIAIINSHKKEIQDLKKQVKELNDNKNKDL